MDIIGIDISVEPRGPRHGSCACSPDKAKFDTALLMGDRTRHATFSNTEAGFKQLLAWLEKQRPDPAAPLHVCMEATGNWGLELADALHGRAMQVSVVNLGRTSRFDPARIRAC